MAKSPLPAPSDPTEAFNKAVAALRHYRFEVRYDPDDIEGDLRVAFEAAGLPVP